MQRPSQRAQGKRRVLSEQRGHVEGAEHVQQEQQSCPGRSCRARGRRRSKHPRARRCDLPRQAGACLVASVAGEPDARSRSGRLAVDRRDTGVVAASLRASVSITAGACRERARPGSHSSKASTAMAGAVRSPEADRAAPVTLHRMADARSSALRARDCRRRGCRPRSASSCWFRWSSRSHVVTSRGAHSARHARASATHRSAGTRATSGDRRPAAGYGAEYGRRETRLAPERFDRFVTRRGCIDGLPRAPDAERAPGPCTIEIAARRRAGHVHQCDEPVAITNDIGPALAQPARNRFGQCNAPRDGESRVGLRALEAHHGVHAADADVLAAWNRRALQARTRAARRRLPTRARDRDVPARRSHRPAGDSACADARYADRSSSHPRRNAKPACVHRRAAAGPADDGAATECAAAELQCREPPGRRRSSTICRRAVRGRHACLRRRCKRRRSCAPVGAR